MELKFLGQVEVLDVVAVRGSREENRRPLEPADSLGPTSSRFVMTFVDHDQPESPMKFLVRVGSGGVEGLERRDCRHPDCLPPVARQLLRDG